MTSVLPWARPAGAAQCQPDCGRCCDPVQLGYPVEEVTKWSAASIGDAPDPRTDEGWAAWREHGWRDSARAGVIRKFDPAGDTRRNADFLDANWSSAGRGPGLAPSAEGAGEAWLYACAAYDRDTRRCTAHDTRPPICRGYPWYGGPPVPDSGTSRGMPPACSYNADVRTTLPIVGVTHRSQPAERTRQPWLDQ